MKQMINKITEKLSKYSNKKLIIISIILIMFGISYLKYVIGILFFYPAFLCLKVCYDRKRMKHIPSASAVVTQQPENKVTDESMVNYNLFEDVLENNVLKYEYEDNLCLIDDDAINIITGNGGKTINFVPEPNNEYDGKAIAVYLNQNKIGYVYRGRIQDMINDWIAKNRVFTGYINKIYFSSKKASYKIGFYVPLDMFECKTFPLIKTKKKIDDGYYRSDNILCCEEGDAVIIEYRDYDDCYVVYNDMYDEIGELGAKAAEYIEEHEDKKIVGIINECTIDYDDSVHASITVYIVK